MNKYIIILNNEDIVSYPYTITIKEMYKAINFEVDTITIRNMYEEKSFIKCIKNDKKKIVISDYTKIKESSLLKSIYYEDIDMIDIMSLLHGEFKMIFSSEIEDIVDYFNMECDIPKNSKEYIEVISSFLFNSAKEDMINRNIDYIKSKLKNLYLKSSYNLGKYSSIHNLQCGNLRGYNIVFTGKGPYVRSHLSFIASKNGAIVSRAVSSRTNCLVVGEKPGSKLNMAKRLNMDIISMDQFFKIIEGDIDKLSLENDIEEEIIEDKVFDNNMMLNAQNFILKRSVIIHIENDESKRKLGQFLSSCMINHVEISDKDIEHLDRNWLVIYCIRNEDSDLVLKSYENDIQAISLGEFTKIINNEAF